MYREMLSRMMTLTTCFKVSQNLSKRRIRKYVRSSKIFLLRSLIKAIRKSLVRLFTESAHVLEM